MERRHGHSALVARHDDQAIADDAHRIINGRKYAPSDPGWSDELGQLDERGIVLQKARGIDCRRFDYLYDFGETGHHVVRVEEPHPYE